VALAYAQNCTGSRAGTVGKDFSAPARFNSTRSPPPGYDRTAYATRLGTAFPTAFCGVIRQAFHLTCRYSRLRAKGFLTAKEMSVRHGVTTTTINAWGRDGLLKKHRYDNARRCLYEPLDQNAILKGQGGRQAKPPTFNVAHAGQGAV